MTNEDILRRFDALRVWKREKEGEKAPHKPLLILYALARWRQGLTTVSFREVEKDLKDLLREFGPPRKSDHPEEPFWRLQNDDVWTEKHGLLDETASIGTRDGWNRRLLERGFSISGHRLVKTQQVGGGTSLPRDATEEAHSERMPSSS